MFWGDGQDYANNVAVELALTGQNMMYNIMYQITV